MLVVCLRPDFDAPCTDDVPHMAAEVRAIMELRQRAVRKRKGERLSGDTAVQDVRLEKMVSLTLVRSGLLRM